MVYQELLNVVIKPIRLLVYVHVNLDN